MTPEDIADAYRDGAYTALEAQRGLLAILAAERERHADALKAADDFERIKKRVNAALYTIAYNSGDVAKGVQLIQPSAVRSYNAAQVDTLVAELSSEGYAEIAARLARCAETKTRAGYVKVVVE